MKATLVICACVCERERDEGLGEKIKNVKNVIIFMKK